MDNRFLLALAGVWVLLMLSGVDRPVLAQPAVQTTAAEIASLPREAVLDGVLEAVNRSTVSAQTAGRVQEIIVDVDDFVPAGTVIVRLRDTEQRAALNQAEAAREEARARYAEAESEYNRIRDVFRRNLVSRSEMDAATAALDAARARLDSAEAGVQRAREQLDYTVIEAPYSGVVLERHVQLGESVQPGQPLMTGFSLDQLRAVANVPQRLIAAVRRHAQARVILPDGRDIDVARLTFFPYADPDSNVFKVRVHLPDNTEDVYPGMFVKVAFAIGEREQLTVPREALLRRSELTAVYVIEDGAIRLRQVRAGSVVADDRIEILAGLDAGERVALDPVAAGMRLRADSTE